MTKPYIVYYKTTRWHRRPFRYEREALSFIRRITPTASTVYLESNITLIRDVTYFL